MTRVTLTTANTPGAVAIIQLHGGAVIQVLQQLTGRNHWTERRVALCNFGDIDEGLAVVLSAQAAQLMPHGGPRVVQRMIERLTHELGCTYDAKPDTQSLYPEANSPIEADMLDAIAKAASPAAIDLLAAQPKLWRALLQQARTLDPNELQAILDRSRTLDQLITPPTVVVVGPTNAGKSTLTNALLGKAVSIVADLPGTTRDWVGALVELSWELGVGSWRTRQQHDTPEHPNPQRPTPKSQVAVNWLDTPGLRDSDDVIEQRAIKLAKQQIERAEVLIAMRGVDQDWPALSVMTRTPDLWVVNKVDDASRMQPDDAGLSIDHPLRISALQGQGVDALQRAIVSQLGLDQLDAKQPWAFSAELRSHLESNGTAGLQAYLASVTKQ